MINVLNIFIFIVSSCFILEFDPSELLCILLIVETHILAKKDEETQAFNIIRVLLVDSLINFECLLEVSNSTLARCDHELPLDFIGLNLTGSFEVEAGLFIDGLLNIIDSKPDVCVEVRRK